MRTDAARRLVWLSTDDTAASGPLQFEVDRVLTAAEDQAAVYCEVAHGVVDAVARGATGCIMCYGQTGTGKTYTLAGGGGAPSALAFGANSGIVERALRQLLPPPSEPPMHRITKKTARILPRNPSPMSASPRDR